MLRGENERAVGKRDLHLHGDAPLLKGLDERLLSKMIVGGQRTHHRSVIRKPDPYQERPSKARHQQHSFFRLLSFRFVLRRARLRPLPKGSMKVMDSEPQEEPLAPESIEPATPIERRNAAGWILMIVLISLMMVGAMSAYLKPQDSKQKRYEAESTAFESEMMQRSVLGTTSGKKNSGSLSELDETVSKLAKDRFKQKEAAKLYAAIRHEQGYPLKPEDLALLARSDKEEDRDYVRIYGFDSLSQVEAVQIERQLRNGEFVDTMAIVHAFEKAGLPDARPRLFAKRNWNVKFAASIGIMLVAGLGLALWALYAIRRSQGFWKPLGHPLQFMSALQADGNAMRVSLVLVAYSILPIFIILPLKSLLVEDALTVLSLLLVFAGVLVVIRLRILGEALNLKEIMGDLSMPGQKVLWGIGGAIANAPVAIVLGLIGLQLFKALPTPTHPAVEELMNSKSPFAVIVFFFTAVVMAPLIEEITFRGLMLPSISRVAKSIPKGVLWSSLAFACIHPQGIALWPALAGLGAVCSLLAYQTRSLLPSMVMHAVHNGALMVLTLLFM